MIGAVPTIRQWKLASLPKHLSVEEVDRTLATCDEKSPAGRRDRAILLLLLRLALRAGQVARLRLSDVDWSEGELRVYSFSGKDVGSESMNEKGCRVKKHLSLKEPRLSFLPPLRPPADII